jgi:hypothetical protein
MTALTNLWAVDPRLKLLGLHISDDENISTVMRFGSVAANQCKACYAGRHGRFTLDNILEILLKISFTSLNTCQTLLKTSIIGQEAR